VPAEPRVCAIAREHVPERQSKPLGYSTQVRRLSFTRFLGGFFLPENQAPAPVNKNATDEPLDHTTRVNTISALEAKIGPYHPKLSEALLEAAEQALRAGWLDEANGLFSQALHNKRINEGLYSEGQLQIVQKLATILRMQGDRAGLRDRADYYYRILGAGKIQERDVIE